MSSNDQQVVDALVSQGVPLDLAQKIVRDDLPANMRGSNVSVDQATAVARQIFDSKYQPTAVANQGGHAGTVPGLNTPLGQKINQIQSRIGNPYVSRPLGWKNVTPMPADQLMQALGGNLAFTQWANQPLPSTTHSIYALPTGVPGPGNKAVSLPTVQDQWSVLTRMSSDDLARFQAKLLDGGYYQNDQSGNPPKVAMGRMDDATTRAFNNLVIDSTLHPNVGMQELLETAAQSNVKDLATQRQSKVNSAVAQAMAASGVTNAASLTNTIDLADTMLEKAQNAIGRRYTPAEVQKFVDSFHADEKVKAQTRYDALVKKAQSAAQGVSDEEVDQFLNAVTNGDGSGQFVHAPGSNALGMDAKTWATWADKVGLSSSAPQTPDNLHLVGKEIALYYYGQYGNWQDVARRWFAGPGSGNAWAGGTPHAAGSLTGGLNQIDTTLDGRVDVVTRAMRAGVFANSAAANGANAGTNNQALEFTESTPDVAKAADMWLQQNNPVEYATHPLGERGQQFFDMLAAPAVNVPTHN